MDEKKKMLKISVILIAALVLVSILGGTGDDSMVDISENTAESAQPEEATELERVREFTSAEFKEAFDSLSLPNITPIIATQSTTGSEAADTRINELAEERGYRLQYVASGLLNSIEGKPVQELLIKDWNDLQTSAQQNGISVNFVSGYRSIEDQLGIFTARLFGAGATVDGIISGADDAVVDAVLQTTAPPGYSRHHSGYTIDLEDPGFEVFAFSTAYQWLSSNNFENAKLYGFIPSYPEDLVNQGPNPEAWEFVWVGKQATFE